MNNSNSKNSKKCKYIGWCYLPERNMGSLCLCSNFSVFVAVFQLTSLIEQFQPGNAIQYS